jgi:hypothetical protein
MTLARAIRCGTTLFTIVAIPGTVFGQNRASSLSDSAIIAREWSVWNAIKDKDAAAVARNLGDASRILTVTNGSVGHTSAAAFAKRITTDCVTNRNQLDSVRVDHPSPTTVMLTYHVDLDRVCGGKSTAAQLESFSVWVYNDGRWQAAAQDVTVLPAKPKS